MPDTHNGIPYVIPADPLHALPTTWLELAEWIDNNLPRNDDGRLTNARTPTAHDHDDRYYTETELDQKLGGKVSSTDSRLSDARTPTAHNHDDRYYTETEVDQKLGGKRNREAVELDSGADANNLTDPGTYIETYAFDAANHLNFPEKAAGKLDVAASSTRVRVEQSWRSFDTGNRYERSRNSGTWTPWDRLVSESLLTARIGYAGYDSGWRDVSTDLLFGATGTLHIRRIGMAVYWRVMNLVSGTAHSFYLPPAGMRATGAVTQPSQTPTGTDEPFYLDTVGRLCRSTYVPPLPYDTRFYEGTYTLPPNTAPPATPPGKST